jgi:hypothetical protein
MKTSKIKNIVNTNEWKGSNGIVIYHNLEMENGDKISLGKMKKLEVGEELNYEITSTAQEYNKAKSVMANFAGNNFKSDPDRNKAIVKQTCMKAAAALYSGTKDIDGMFFAWEKIENKFYNKETVKIKEDLPF